MKYGCKTCRKPVRPKKGRLICCGHNEPVPKLDLDRKDLLGRLHGSQPVFGSGEMHYRHGTLEYLDDGNGNVFDVHEETYGDDY